MGCHTNNKFENHNNHMSTVTSAAELGRSVNNGEDEIIIEGDLAKKTIRIKATGKVAWAIAFGAIGVALVIAISGAGAGPAAPAFEAIAITSAGGAVAVIGLPATVAALSMAFAVKNKKVLNSLRDDYIIMSKSTNRVVLKRK